MGSENGGNLEYERFMGYPFANVSRDLSLLGKVLHVQGSAEGASFVEPCRGRAVRLGDKRQGRIVNDVRLI